MKAVQKNIYEIPDFHKRPDKFESYLVELLDHTSVNKLSVYVLKLNTEAVKHYPDALIVITETIGKINQREVYKYHLLGRWNIHYWKSRAYFAACCALLYKHGLSVTGYFVKRDCSLDVFEGEKLLEYDFDEQDGGVNFSTVCSWGVSDFIEMPEEYLKNVEVEKDFAVRMWLDLSEQGYMRCFPDEKNFDIDVEASFKNKL